MTESGQHGLFSLAIWYLGSTVLAAAVTFGALVVLTLPITIRVVGNEAKALSLIALLSLSAYLGARNLMGEPSSDELLEQSLSVKIAAVFLSISYYNLVLLVAFFLYIIADFVVGTTVATFVIVGYPIYDVWSLNQRYVPSVGAFLRESVYITGKVVEGAVALRNISYTDSLFIIFERTRHPGLR